MRIKHLYFPAFYFLFLLYGLKDREVRNFLKKLRKLHKKVPEIYAQNLQDAAAEVYTTGKNKFYIDLGAAYPIKYSNTYLLQRIGWQGLLVEANPNFWNELSNRVDQKTKIHKGAVGIDKGSTHLLNAGPLSSLIGYEDSDTYGTLRRELSGRDGIIAIETTPVSELLRDIGVDANFDYLSIDIEGLDIIILKQFFKDGYRPEFITIEHNYVPSAIQAICDLSSMYSYNVICHQISGQDFWLKRKNL